MCGMTSDLLNNVCIIWVDILRIMFYAALPFTVLAQEAAKTVWNTWSHLLPGTVNNDRLRNTKLWSQSLYLHKYTQGKSINKKKDCNSYSCVGWICYKTHQKELVFSTVSTKSELKSVSKCTFQGFKFLGLCYFPESPPAMFMEVMQTYLSSDSLLQMEKCHHRPYSTFVRHRSCIVCIVNVPQLSLSQLAMGPEVIFYRKLKFFQKHFMKLSKWTVYRFRQKYLWNIP